MGSAGLLSLQNAHSESYVDDLEFSMDIRTLHRTSSLLLTNFFLFVYRRPLNNSNGEDPTT